MHITYFTLVTGGRKRPRVEEEVVEGNENPSFEEEGKLIEDSNHWFKKIFDLYFYLR